MPDFKPRKTITIEQAMRRMNKTDLAKACDGIATVAISHAIAHNAASPPKQRNFRIELDEAGEPIFLVEKMPPWRRVRSNKRAKAEGK